jgi:hypothetical protein
MVNITVLYLPESKRKVLIVELGVSSWLEYKQMWQFHLVLRFKEYVKLYGRMHIFPKCLACSAFPVNMIISVQGLQRYFESVMQGILRHVNFDVVKCILIASPGFVRDQFYEYMFQQAVKLDNKILLENKSKFMLIHSSSGFKHSLRGNIDDYK